MRAAGMPLVPGSEGGSRASIEARAGRRRGGRLPRAAQGGLGRRRTRDARRRAPRASSSPQYATAQAEAEAAFGDGGLYLEKIVVDAHHVEVQVVGDGQGGALVVGERECCVQRRHQKLLEESPSPFLSDETRTRMLRRRARGRARDALPQRRHDRVPGLGTTQAFFFMEMNTRLQVEHPVTEEVTGIDLVRSQLRARDGRAAAARRASRPRTGTRSSSALNAEDPARGFMPVARAG